MSRWFTVNKDLLTVERHLYGSLAVVNRRGVRRALWGIAVGAFWSLFSYLALRGSSILKTVDTLTEGRQLADPEKERQRTAQAIRFVLMLGSCLGSSSPDSGSPLSSLPSSIDPAWATWRPTAVHVHRRGRGIGPGSSP
jgi:hypothetical protein